MTIKEEQLIHEIAALERDLSGNFDTGWCLGDPYEMLSELRRELAEERENDRR